MTQSNPPIFLQNPQNQHNPQELRDISETITLLNNFTSSQKQTNTKIDSLLNFTMKNHEVNSIQNDNTPKYYAYKNLIMNNYLILLKFYQLFRLNGVDMSQGKGLEMYQQLFYFKTILMKLGPIDKKLEYQRDKILSSALKNNKIDEEQEEIDDEEEQMKQLEDDEQNVDNENYEGEQRQDDDEDELNQQNDEANQLDQQEQLMFQQKPKGKKSKSKSNKIVRAKQDEQQDQLFYRPNVNKLLKSSNKVKQNVHKTRNQDQQQKYRAPKLAAAMPADQKHKQKIQRSKERKKAMFIRQVRGDLQQVDYAEEKGMQSDMYHKFQKKYEQKLRFEEQNFMRLPQTRKQKQWKKQMMKNQFKGSQLNDELKQVQMIRQLIEDEENNKGSRRPEPPKAKKPIKKRKLN